MIERGTGFPVVLVPGIQGRWEWMEPTVNALGQGHRVMTFSLQELRPTRDRDGVFPAWTRALDEIIDRSRERKVSLVGVSFGGLIAARYAARRRERVTSLVIASSPSPRWRPRQDDEFCIRFPRLSLPYFGARGLARLAPEVVASRESWPLRWQLLVEHAKRVLRAPLEPVRMAEWMREFMAYDLAADCHAITAPTLIVTGESKLDRVVPVWETKRYLRMIPGSKHQVLAGTGHLGSIMKPQRFAELVGQFIYNVHAAERSAAMFEQQAAAARSQHAS